MNFFRKIWNFIDTVNKNKAVEYYEWELQELKNTFAVLVAGTFIGLPSPPVYLTLELLPYMEEELKIMFERIDASSNSLGELFSMYDIA